MGKFYEGCAEALIRHVRFTAWLNTAPAEERKQSVSKVAVKPFTRLEKLQDERGADYEPEMPELFGHEQLLGFLWECGPTMDGAMGAQPLTHTEIHSWQQNTGNELNAWEARTLRRLSIEYLVQSTEAKSPNCPSPLAPPEMTAAERAAVSEKVQGALRMLMNTRPKRGNA